MTRKPISRRKVKGATRRRGSNTIDPKFQAIRALLKGALADGVKAEAIAKRAGCSTSMLYQWTAGISRTCRLDKAQGVLRAIDREMMLGD